MLVIFLQYIKKQNIEEVYFLNADNKHENLVRPSQSTHKSPILAWYPAAESIHFELGEKDWKE